MCLCLEALTRLDEDDSVRDDCAPHLKENKDTDALLSQTAEEIQGVAYVSRPAFLTMRIKIEVPIT